VLRWTAPDGNVRGSACCADFGARNVRAQLP
jgi:hypothetical protein